MLVFLGVLLALLWLVLAYGAYEESKREKYEVRVKPGAVTYGTRSTVTLPAISVPARTAGVPMISGRAVRAYAHYGHAAIPNATSGSNYKLHTTSSATVHTIGSGGMGGGGMMSGGASSSRGIVYGGASVSMPTLAMAISSRSMESVTYQSSAMDYEQQTAISSTSASPARMSGIRRILPNGNGEYNGEYDPATGKWWNAVEDDWVDDPFDGAKRYNETLGYMEEYKDGIGWVKVEDQVDPTPLGDTPWHWIVLLALGYGTIRTLKIRKQKIYRI